MQRLLMPTSFSGSRSAWAPMISSLRAITRLWRGNLAAAGDHSQKGISQYDCTRHHALAFAFSGHKVEARDLLASIHGWFTEGFDMLDLQEAKSLLDALAP